LPHWSVLGVFVLGVVLMRSAGCVANDLADRKFDPHVERTRQRPLVTGAVSVREALWLFAFLVALAAALVAVLRNTLLLQLAGIALFLAASYPFTKRFFVLPQAYLGIAFGFGIPMAYAAILNTVPAIAWWLLLANVFWALAYDTEYAMVDRDDDLKLNLKTSAITFGRFDVMAVMLCYGATLALLAWVGWRLGLGVFYCGSLAVAAVIAAYHYTLIRNREHERCFRAFLHNNWFGAAIFAGIVGELHLAPWLRG